MAELTGRRIIVTGGASGMGAGLVRAYPQLGAKVVSMDVNADAGKDIAAQSGAGFVRCDVTDKDSVDAAFDSAAAELGGLDVRVHAAGVAPRGDAASTTVALWEQVMAVNARGTMLTNQAAFRRMRDGGGQIVDFASGAGVRGLPGKAAYSAAKGAVVAWIRVAAVEWAPYGVTVNAVAPAIWTPMYDKTRSELTPDQLVDHDAQMARTIPLGGKLGDVERDLVPVLTFLASNAARFITGQVLPVDGGGLMMR